MAEIDTPAKLREAVSQAGADFERVNIKMADFLYLGKVEFNMALGGDPRGWTPGESIGRSKYLGYEVIPVCRTHHLAMS
jgi:hypothetical protein